MKFLNRAFFLTILIAYSSAYSSVPALAAGLQDVPYNFDSAKLDQASDSFHFLRSYVDYFYLLIQKNKSQFKTLSSTQNTSGWCVGDAHAENFGFLIRRDGKPLFTMNDMDDSGPCPVVLDIVRLLASSLLYDPNIDAEALLQSYQRGLQGKAPHVPSVIGDMQKKSLSRGTPPSPKKVSGNQIIRDDQMQELTRAQINQIHSAIASALGSSLPANAQIVDAVQTSKIGGGSGGMTRFEVLYLIGSKLLHIELKEETTPSIYPVATATIPPVLQRIQQTIGIEQGAYASPLYSAVDLFGKSMLIRPRYYGNVGVSLDKQSVEQNENIIYFEAYLLGIIHAKTVSSEGLNQLLGLAANDLRSDANLLAQAFDSKFNELKGK